jgi:hypothetical protein
VPVGATSAFAIGLGSCGRLSHSAFDVFRRDAFRMRIGVCAVLGARPVGVRGLLGIGALVLAHACFGVRVVRTDSVVSDLRLLVLCHLPSFYLSWGVSPYCGTR